MEHIIRIDLSEEGKLVTEPGFNPREGVLPGDTVTWQCIGRAAGKGLRVVLQGLFDRTPLESKAQDQFSRTVSEKVQRGSIFAYDIVRDDPARGEVVLEWADGANTGKICIPDPPTRGTGG